MHARHLFPLLVLLLCAALAGGCAPAAGAGEAGSPSAGARETLRIQVNNTLVPPTAVTVYVQESGASTRRIVGDARSQGQSILTYSPTGSVGTFRLVARATSGGEMVSQPVTAAIGQTIVWDLQSNSILVQ